MIQFVDIRLWHIDLESIHSPRFPFRNGKLSHVMSRSLKVVSIPWIATLQKYIPKAYLWSLTLIFIIQTCIRINRVCRERIKLTSKCWNFCKKIRNFVKKFTKLIISFVKSDASLSMIRSIITELIITKMVLKGIPLMKTRRTCFVSRYFSRLLYHFVLIFWFGSTSTAIWH